MSTRHFKVNVSKIEFPTPHEKKKKKQQKHAKQLQPPMNRRPSASLAAFPILGNSSSVFNFSGPNLEVIPNSVLSLLTPHPVYPQILMTLFFFFSFKNIYLFIWLSRISVGACRIFFSKLQHAGILVVAWRILICSV